MVPESPESDQGLDPERRLENVTDLEAAKRELRPSLGHRLMTEFKSRPFGYTVLALFMIAGPIAAPYLFPQAPPAAAVVGGLAFGVYAALSAVPQKFL